MVLEPVGEWPTVFKRCLGAWSEEIQRPASPRLMASIDDGLGDAEAGRVHAHAAVVARLAKRRRARGVRLRDREAIDAYIAADDPIAAVDVA